MARNDRPDADEISKTADCLNRSMREHAFLLGSLVRDMLAKRYADCPFLFSDLVEHPVTIPMREWDRLLADMVDDGLLAQSSLIRLRGCDLIIRGDEAETPTHLVFRVAGIVTEHDVHEAVNFAALLADTELTVRPAVAGHQITRDALALVDRLGVGRMLEAELDEEDPISDEDVVPSTLFRAPRVQP